jgi:hypothetical protein
LFLKYYCLAVVQIVLFVFVMPPLVAFVAALVGGEKVRGKLWHLAVGLMLVIEVLVMIDKGGIPFLTGHVVNMYLYTPLSLQGQLFVGLIGDALLVLSFRTSFKKPFEFGLKLRSKKGAKA